MSAQDGAGWIAVVGWDEYLHYSDRAPVWIKLPVRLNSDDGWCELNPGARGIFAGLLLEYARTFCRLRADTRGLSRRLACQVTQNQLEALSHAGLIRIVASSSLAAGYHTASPHALAREEERRGKTRAVEESRNEGTAQDLENGKGHGRLDELLPAPAVDELELERLERSRRRIGRPI